MLENGQCVSELPHKGTRSVHVVISIHTTVLLTFLEAEVTKS